MIDLDGTLLDTAPDLAAAANAHARRARPPAAATRDRSRPSSARACRELVKRCAHRRLDARPSRTRAVRNGRCRSSSATTATHVSAARPRIYPGVVEGLDSAPRPGPAAGLHHQQGRRVHASRCWRTLGLRRYFERGLSAATRCRSRSRDPLPLLHACKRSGRRAGRRRC
ncbi:MAG: hypothetical protein MZW92_80700 [Comamonadaceae bacterium]|nr:hypothetical protein [Comamonadaceae bacterium]